MNSPKAPAPTGRLPYIEHFSCCLDAAVISAREHTIHAARSRQITSVKHPMVKPRTTSSPELSLFSIEKLKQTKKQRTLPLYTAPLSPASVLPPRILAKVSHWLQICTTTVPSFSNVNLVKNHLLSYSTSIL